MIRNYLNQEKFETITNLEKKSEKEPTGFHIFNYFFRLVYKACSILNKDQLFALKKL